MFLTFNWLHDASVIQWLACKRTESWSPVQRVLVGCCRLQGVQRRSYAVKWGVRQTVRGRRPSHNQSYDWIIMMSWSVMKVSEWLKYTQCIYWTFANKRKQSVLHKVHNRLFVWLFVDWTCLMWSFPERLTSTISNSWQTMSPSHLSPVYCLLSNESLE